LFKGFNALEDEQSLVPPAFDSRVRHSTSGFKPVGTCRPVDLDIRMSCHNFYPVVEEKEEEVRLR
jgi:hypothetical protein